MRWMLFVSLWSLMPSLWACQDYVALKKATRAYVVKSASRKPVCHVNQFDVHTGAPLPDLVVDLDRESLKREKDRLAVEWADLDALLKDSE